MRTLLFLIFVLFCCSCKKEEKHTVVYKVNVLHGNPSYYMQYSSLHNTTKSEGPVTASSWTSPVIDDRKSSSTVSFTMIGGIGGTYQMFIIVDGSVKKEFSMEDPYGPQTITADIGD